MVIGACDKGPVFVFSAGWRSGSTLLQRLITSSGEVLVWGEGGGALNSLEDAWERYRQMLGDGGNRFRHGFGGNGLQQYELFRKDPQNSIHKWVASMNPPENVFLDGLRTLLEGVYGDAARESGYPRWGIKEVVCGLDTARFLGKMWPDARFVFLVRHPLSCLLSIKRRGWIDHPSDRGRVEYFMRHWRRLAREFREGGMGYLVRYEDIINKEDELGKLSEYIGVKSLSMEFIGKSKADWPAQNEEKLTYIERRKALSIVREEMKHHGYTVEG